MIFSSAADLLRQIYPGLVPERGGGDAGMDGAISAGDDPPLPLICTTEKNVLDNRRRSVTSYLSEGWFPPGRGGPDLAGPIPPLAGGTWRLLPTS